MNPEVGLYNDAMCVICESVGDEKLVTMRSDDRNKLQMCSVIHGTNDLTKYLSSDPPVVKVHKSCQLDFTSARRIEQKRKINTTVTLENDIKCKLLRSSNTDVFQWKKELFFMCKSNW